MKTDSNQFININVIYNKLVSELSDVPPHLRFITGCEIRRKM